MTDCSAPRAPFLTRPVPIAVLRAATPETALAMADALRSGGVMTIEVTFTVPDAAQLVAELSSQSDAVVGAGTVTTTRQVEDMAGAGARFIVSPGLDEAVVRAAQRCGLPVLPGVLTPTEAMAARALGVDTVKLFPASTVDIGHMKALRQVFPDLGFVPTGGIGLAEAPGWLAGGAQSIGFGGVLESVFRDEGVGGLESLAVDLVRLFPEACESRQSSRRNTHEQTD